MQIRIADVVRSIAEGGRYSAEEGSSAIDELLQELDRHHARLRLSCGDGRVSKLVSIVRCVRGMCQGRIQDETAFWLRASDSLCDSSATSDPNAPA